MHSFPDDTIGDVLRRLAEMGDPLEDPRDIDFDCTFPSDVLAEQFIGAVRCHGYKRAESMHWQKLGCWCVSVSVFMMPEHGPMSRIREHLVALASEFMGDFDGCGCFIDNAD